MWFMLLLLVLMLAPAAGAASSLPAPGGRHYSTGLLKLPQAFRGLGGTYVKLKGCTGLPADYDLRELEIVPNVKDQGPCGSCWAYAKTASLESAVKAAASDGSPLLDLSEQELVSCDKANYGCDGGMLNQNEYQVAVGQTDEASFPYTARGDACVTGLAPVAKALSFVRLKKIDDEQVKCALFRSRTIPWITVSADGTRWSRPPTGDMAVWPARANNTQTNHAVGLVGWRTIKGKTYFIMRNSWGNLWGSTGGRPTAERGYALIPLGADALGEEVAYATTGTAPCEPPRPLLPIEITANIGDELVLAVKPDKSATFTWLKGEREIAKGGWSIVFKVESSEGLYKVLAENTCGRGESTVRIKALTVKPQ